MSTNIASFQSEYGTYIASQEDTGPVLLLLKGETITIQIGFIHVNSMEEAGDYCKGIFIFFDAFLRMHRFESKYEVADNIRAPSKFKDAYLRFIIERFGETYKLRKYIVPGGKDAEVHYIPLDTESEYSDPMVYQNDYICAVQTPYANFRIPSTHPDRRYSILIDKPRELSRELAFLYTREKYAGGNALIEAASFRYLMGCARHEMEVISKYRMKSKLPILLEFMNYASDQDSIRLALRNRVARDDPR